MHTYMPVPIHSCIHTLIFISVLARAVEGESNTGPIWWPPAKLVRPFFGALIVRILVKTAGFFG